MQLAKIRLNRPAGNIRAQFGNYSFDRFDRSVRLSVWHGRVGYSSRRGELRTSVPDLFTLRVLTGLLRPPEKQVLPLEQRRPNILFVEPRDLPRDFVRESFGAEPGLIGFCSDLLQQASDLNFDWSGGVSLADVAASPQLKTALCHRLAHGAGPAPRDLLLVNLIRANGDPRQGAELDLQVSQLFYQQIFTQTQR